MKKIGKAFWITIGIGAIFFAILVIVSSTLQLGERLKIIHPFVAYGFYLIVAVLFVLLVLRPLFLIIFSPTFSMDSLFTEEENARKNFQMYRRVAKNLASEDFLSEDESFAHTQPG